MQKRDRAALFRQRVELRLQSTGTSRSALARACNVDRSTIAQILGDGEARLPNAHLAAACAEALGVSADWLLGLTEHPETAAERLSTAFRFSEAARTPSDTQLLEWHREAAGYKIRHVPASLPDILKIEPVLQFEYARFLEKTPEQASGTLRDTMSWLRAPGSDYEICAPTEMLTSLARGEGYWRGLPADVRHAQLTHMADLCNELYPSLRFYLYDEKMIYSAPITIFGPLLAAVYIGSHYLVFREAGQVQAITHHFDEVVRNSEYDARGISDIIEALAETIEEDGELADAKTDATRAA
ncbi:MAG: helix-turn-helix domain-containing protein [Pseudomonadota bacterium]